jgi:two-component system sensor histidine kinase
MQTQIYPIREDFSKGIQATIENPYKMIILQMRMFLIGTVLLLFIVIYCLVQQIKVIAKQNKIAKIREDFSYAMIHDMKTPLSSILMGTRILRSGKLDDKPERKEKYFDIMEDEEEHLLALVNKVLTLSKLEEGKLLLEKTEVELRPIIEDLIEKFTAKAEKQVEFALDLQEEKAYADEEFLKEALSNLIDNAIKYSGESVQIKISSSASTDGYTHISVTDNGMGIPLKEQGKIFEKFERASAVIRNRKGGASGFGLGLNYVLHVVEAHHGSVKLESIEGEYSKFTINIPQHNGETA